MSSSITQLLKNKKIICENYATNLNMILVNDDLHFILIKECPPFPTRNPSHNVRDAYNSWTMSNDKTCIYLLFSMFDILSKKHETMITTHQIMDSLQEIFKTNKK